MSACVRDTICRAIDAHKDELKTLSTYIWNNPELSQKEFQAHDYLTEYLEKQGFAVERKYLSCPEMETAFRATFGSGRPNVCVICEYDALPDVGRKL